MRSRRKATNSALAESFGASTKKSTHPSSDTAAKLSRDTAEHASEEAQGCYVDGGASRTRSCASLCITFQPPCISIVPSAGARSCAEAQSA